MKETMPFGSVRREHKEKTQRICDMDDLSQYLQLNFNSLSLTW